ncbi:hypothetical protein BDF20DRAFT_912630 [Mycotypha africana]|uniref:uncharacterized protein n=1 Tax=Mycotypha africana TaxID=64632 RepID=UPI0022FFF9E1|nr:uncharacterized protein BDF20DRAFT_912630 [Mycotypha africana]KAI8982476.1 hypothetical protein BDF20DRAFT_912630 [Mycotypha africana]
MSRHSSSNMQQFHSDAILRSAINESDVGIDLEDTHILHYYCSEGDTYGTIIERSNFRSLYDPDSIGWCGYSCLAFAIGLSPAMADRLGSAQRWRLLINLRDHRPQWPTFLGDQEYDLLWTQISLVPNESSDWWFSNSLAWVCVHSFARSFLLFDTQQNVPCLFRRPADPLIAINVRTNYIIAVQFRSLAAIPNIVPDFQTDHFQQ